MKRKRLFIFCISLLLIIILLSSLSKRPTNLGILNGRLAPAPSSPTAVSTFASLNDEQHYIAPISSSKSRVKDKETIKALLATWPRTQLITETQNYLHYECTSLVFRFVDDLEIYIDETTNLIHFRSASRVGHSDFGLNRKRVNHLKSKMY